MNQPLVLVTGSSGLIGRAVIERLAGVYDVVGMSRSASEGAPGDFLELDVTSDDSVRQALAAVRERHGRKVASDPLRPEWDYPRSKVATEELLRAERGDVPVVLARIAGVYDEWCHSIPIAHQVRRLAERDPTAYVFPGDPGHGQAFLHLADLVDAVERSIERRGDLSAELPLLLGERKAMSYDELQDDIGRLLYGVDGWPTRRIPIPSAGTARKVSAA